MTILNLGCGRKICPQPEVVNIDWSLYLRLARSSGVRIVARMLMTARQRGNLDALVALNGNNLVVHNLARGIPYPSNSVDAVYHSHLLEHLDRDIAPTFLREVHRVLKPGGIQRIVVPDLERCVRYYIESISRCEDDNSVVDSHDDAIAGFLAQSVRRDAAAATGAGALRRYIERMVLGDARARGETHQWMYDRINLGGVLRRTGFRDVAIVSNDKSAIPDWSRYSLDVNEAGGERIPGSLYVEALK